MNYTKTFGLILTLFLALSVVSALSLSSPSQLTQNTNQSTFTLSNNNAVAQNISLTVGSIVSGSNQATFSLSPSQVNNLAVSASSSITLKLDQVFGKIPFGKNTVTINANGIDASSGAAVSNASTSFTFLSSFCKSGAKGDLEITEVDFSSSGDDDETWKVLDEITVSVDVENTGDEDLNDIIVEIALYDSSGKDQIGSVDFINTDEDEIDIGDLNDGDEETAEFQFTIPADFDEGDYKLAVKAYSDDEGESNVCTDESSDLDNDFYQAIDVEAEDDEGKFIAFDEIEIPTEVTCGDSVTLNFEAFNIGDDEQDQVRINLENSELKVDLSQEIRENLDKGDSVDLSFTFTVPQTAKDKTYSLELTADYDYSRGNYRESSDDSKNVPLKVIGCSPTSSTTKIASISASLESDAEAGQPMVVNARITNLGTQSATFSIDAVGYSSWADLESISSRSLTIDAGDSKEVTLILNVNDDASGDQDFTINVNSAGKTESRDVSVSLAEKQSGSSLSSLFSGNYLIWVIALVNIILIVLIIVVAVKVARR